MFQHSIYRCTLGSWYLLPADDVFHCTFPRLVLLEVQHSFAIDSVTYLGQHDFGIAYVLELFIKSFALEYICYLY